MEGTPGYFRNATAIARRVQSLLPNAKLVLALRNPAEMAVSIFTNDQGRGKIHFDSCGQWFKETARAQDLQACLGMRPHPLKAGAHAKTRSAWTAAYAKHAACIEAVAAPNTNALAAGYYGALLFQWRLQFPRGQFVLINSEQMFENATLTMNEVFAQIGLRAYRGSESKNLGVVNKTPPGKGGAKEIAKQSCMAGDTMDRMNSYFHRARQDLFVVLREQMGFSEQMVETWKSRWHHHE